MWKSNYKDGGRETEIESGTPEGRQRKRRRQKERDEGGGTRRYLRMFQRTKVVQMDLTHQKTSATSWRRSKLKMLNNKN